MGYFPWHKMSMKFHLGFNSLQEDMLPVEGNEKDIFSPELHDSSLQIIVTFPAEGNGWDISSEFNYRVM